METPELFLTQSIIELKHTALFESTSETSPFHSLTTDRPFLNERNGLLTTVEFVPRLKAT
jgi:hypothetical protein